MGIPVLEVHLRVEFRRVTRAASGRPGKTHLLVNDVPMCDVADYTGWQEARENGGTERVDAREFLGSNACTRCWSEVGGVTVDEAKQRLAEQQVRQRGGAGAATTDLALWVNPGEIWWDSGQPRSIHFILRGQNGWERHKIVTDVDGRKHQDTKLYEALAARLS